jgi:hypothetical protein
MPAALPSRNVSNTRTLRWLTAPLDFPGDLTPDFLALTVVDFGESGRAAQRLVIGCIPESAYHAIDDPLHRRVVHYELLA